MTRNSQLMYRPMYSTIIVIYTSCDQSSFLRGADTLTILKAYGKRLQAVLAPHSRHLVVRLRNQLDRQSPKRQVYQTYVQSSMTENWLCSDMSDACQKALQHMTSFMHRLSHMPAWYHILAGEESQEDCDVPGHVTF